MSKPKVEVKLIEGGDDHYSDYLKVFIDGKPGPACTEIVCGQKAGALPYLIMTCLPDKFQIEVDQIFFEIGGKEYYLQEYISEKKGDTDDDV